MREKPIYLDPPGSRRNRGRGRQRRQSTRGAGWVAVLLLALALLDGSLALAFPLFLPYFTVGFLSHLVLDLCNQKGLKLFYPCKYGVCLGWFRAHGWADRLLCTAGCAAALLLSVKSFWEMFLGKL